MNKAIIAILALAIVASIFLLLDDSETAPSRDREVKSSIEVNSEKVEEDSVNISYEETKKVEPKKEEKPKKVAKSREPNRDYINKVIAEYELKRVTQSKTFIDSSKRYLGTLMVNYQATRNSNMFPQIPIMANIDLPTGETMPIQLDPSIAQANDKIYLLVDDKELENSMIYDVSDFSSLGSGQRADVTLNRLGTIEDLSESESSLDTSSMPPMPTFN